MHRLGGSEGQRGGVLEGPGGGRLEGRGMRPRAVFGGYVRPGRAARVEPQVLKPLPVVLGPGCDLGL